MSSKIPIVSKQRNEVKVLPFGKSKWKTIQRPRIWMTTSYCNPLLELQTRSSVIIKRKSTEWGATPMVNCNAWSFSLHKASWETISTALHVLRMHLLLWRLLLVVKCCLRLLKLLDLLRIQRLVLHLKHTQPTQTQALARTVAELSGSKLQTLYFIS